MLYPTNLRSQAVSLCSLVARIFGACAPFVVQLGKFYAPLPMVVLGVPAIISGFLTLALRETAGKGLPETEEQQGQEMTVIKPLQVNLDDC